MAYQEDEIKAQCHAQGWTLLHIFYDEGISGAKVDEEALEYLKLDKISPLDIMGP